MSLGEVDTLNLLAEKLDNLFKDSQGYYESFLDANTMYKQGKMTDKEFFEKLGDYTVAYSALEFLAVKVIFELKKAIDRAGAGGLGGTQSPGLMPGMGSPGFAGMPGMGRPQVAPQMPGRPHGLFHAGFVLFQSYRTSPHLLWLKYTLFHPVLIRAPSHPPPE